MIQEAKACPSCGSIHIVKNGSIHNGKPKGLCKDCGRQFVLKNKVREISGNAKLLIKKLLLERISLRGICRAVGVGLKWLLNFIQIEYGKAPDDLNIKVPPNKNRQLVLFKIIDGEMDELWSFVGKKKNKKWVWLAIDRRTLQIISFHVGDRRSDSAEVLWNNLPQFYKENAVFHTDDWEAYKSIVPKDQHFPSKYKKETNHIERLNCTLRQRISRLVRKTLSFSKKFENHVGAIKYFICDYNKNRWKFISY